MKSFFKQSFILFLTVAFLASSTGVTVFKMVCGKNGMGIVSLTQIKNCCKNKNQESESIERKCCDFSTQTFKVSLLHKTETKALSFDLPVLENNFVTPHFVAINIPKAFVTIDSSPPKTGRQILCLNSTFLI